LVRLLQPRWQSRAAANAAAFATDLATDLIEDIAMPPATANPPTDGATWNIATGSARVGVQAGHIHGNVHIGPAADGPADLRGQLAALRDQLRLAHRSGQLDEPTYAAAEQELEAATGALAAGTEQGRGTVTLALKKLRGLLADVADLAARVTTILALARSWR
jgi:8-oxo-dGTP diphosphatase